jgi:hypothetical protein
MAQDPVLPIAGEAQKVFSKSVPAAAAGAEDATPDNHENIPATDVDQTIKAHQGKNTTQLLLPTEEFKQSDLISHLRSYLEASFRPSATEQLLGPLIKVDPILLKASVETELEVIPKGRAINKIVDFDFNGNKILEVSTNSAHRLWLALKVRLLSFCVYKIE